MNKIKKTVLIIGYQCNNNCRFCIDAGKRNLVSKTTVEIKQEMKEAKKRGTTYLELIGGETTIRPDAVELISFARDLGFKTINMATNGRILSYPKYAKQIVEAGLTDIIFSIHGYNAQTHDYLTRAKGSFEQLKKGLANLGKLGFKNIGSNTTIVKGNYKHLKRIGEFIYDQGIRIRNLFLLTQVAAGLIKILTSMSREFQRRHRMLRSVLKLAKKTGFPIGISAMFHCAILPII